MKIYLIVIDGGQYSDKWTSIHEAYFSKELAEIEVKKLEDDRDIQT